MAPKRSLSAYLFYCNEFRESIKVNHPGKRITEIATLLAADWKELNDKKKAKFQKMAADDKARYEAEKALYLASK